MTESEERAIAKVCHEANRAYCEKLDDFSQEPWEEADWWQRKSAIEGVRERLSNPSGTPESRHRAWLQAKADDGWSYGEVKDADAKTHPCFLPWNGLTPKQKRKDALFLAIVDALK